MTFAGPPHEEWQRRYPPDLAEAVIGLNQASEREFSPLWWGNLRADLIQRITQAMGNSEESKRLPIFVHDWFYRIYLPHMRDHWPHLWQMVNPEVRALYDDRSETTTSLTESRMPHGS